MRLSRISSLMRITPQLRSRIMSVNTEPELIRLAENLHLGSGDRAELVNLLNSRMSQIRSAEQSMAQLREQISSATSLHEMNQMLIGRSFSPEEAASLQSVINRKRTEFLSGVSRFSRPVITNLEQARTKMSAVFRRNITSDVANEMALRYKTIFAEQDNMQFVEKLVVQMMKDFGFPPYYLKSGLTKDLPLCSPAGFHFCEGLRISEEMIPELSHMNNRILLFNNSAHELTHFIQHRIAYGTDKIGYLEALAERHIRCYPSEYNQLMTQYNGNRRAVISRIIETELKPKLIDAIKESPQIPKDSPLHKKGLKYIQSMKEYKQPIRIAKSMYGCELNQLTPEQHRNVLRIYKAQHNENEAYQAGDNATEFLNLIMNSG